MNKIGAINFKKIKRISPSQFYSMKNCAYKSLLAEAMNKKPLLPVSANAYFGTVLHKILELISKGAIRNEEDFNTTFQEQVKLMEEKLVAHGYDFFVPLQKKVKDFIMKKILLKDHLRFVSERPPRASNTKFHSEKWYESKDKLIGGKIDLVIEAENETEILDFKTGSITQDVLDDNGEIISEVKAEYKEQLKLYAYLYFENTGKFPTQLSLVDLSKQKFTVDFSEQECNSIFEEAKSLLNSTNNCIEKEIFTANPTEANCKYCLYRPACSFYLKHIETDYSFNDVSGSVQNVVKFQNGNVSLYLESGGKLITVSNLPSEKFDELNNSRNKKINVFNLKREPREFFYSAIKTTMIYE
nr:PD-(D/E)XK nuclease family protein [Candidatus Brachybacter algidus]